MTTSARSSSYLVRFAEDYRSFTRGETIFTQGDAGDCMYAIKEGEVDVLVNGAVVETLGEGSIFGEMALIDTNPRSATVVARTDCKLVPINESRFKYLVQQTPFFAIEVMRVMARRLRQMDARL